LHQRVIREFVLEEGHLSKGDSGGRQERKTDERVRQQNKEKEVGGTLKNQRKRWMKEGCSAKGDRGRGIGKMGGRNHSRRKDEKWGIPNKVIEGCRKD
jgi:hypothetical protein